MLDSMRAAVDSWVSKVLLGLLVVCFAVLWGVPHMTSYSGNTLISSGNSKLNLSDGLFLNADLNWRVSIVAGGRRSFTAAEMNQILPQLYAQIPVDELLPLQMRLQKNVLLDEEVRLMKIGIDKKGIAHEFGRDPFFLQDGVFQPQAFRNYQRDVVAMYRNNLRDSDVIGYYAAKGKRNQLVAGAVGGAKLPETYYRAFNLFYGETRTADYLIITPDMLGKIADPTTEQLDNWFKTNQSDYRAPEYRKVSYMALTNDDIARPQDVSADEVKAFYQQNKAHFSTPEKRDLAILRFANMDSAKQASEKLKAGASFDDIANELQMKPEEISFTKSELPTAVANVVFALSEGAQSDIIDMIGPVIIKVKAVTASAPQPLDAVEDTIRKDIATRNNATASRTIHDAIENARFEGTSLAELAEKYKLQLKTITFDAEGKIEDGTALKGVPQQEQLVQAAFQTETGVDRAPLAVRDGGYLWYYVDAIIPSRDKTLDEVRDQVIKDWKEAETTRKLDEKAKALQSELDSGASIEQLAKQLKTTKETARGLQRSAVPPVFGTVGLAAVFSAPVGHDGVFHTDNDNARILYKVTDAVQPLTTGLGATSPQMQEQLNSTLQRDIETALLLAAFDAHRPIISNIQLYNRFVGGEE